VLEVTGTRGFVKICGVTSPGDADVVARAGASALGVILTSSTRRVDVATARSITARVQGRVVTVAVVDSADRSSLDALMSGVGASVVQVHGELSRALADDLRTRDLAIVKSLSIGTREFQEFDETNVDAVLIDGPVPGSGSAHSFHELRARAFTRPVIAAGGLTPMSVGAVIDAYRVWGVDVASGVESAPGVKDPQRVGEFVDAARRAFLQAAT
jgi:phosphoribosylanthranilate isomerase